jgi:isopentenyl diphosphate isomerase/L-lactate dehydrogenase-like FMN-dependent dehydrogenase
MGHAMVMPWLFAGLRLGIVSAEAELGTAHALSSDGNPKSMPGMSMTYARPVVDPMNMSDAVPRRSSCLRG